MFAFEGDGVEGEGEWVSPLFVSTSEGGWGWEWIESWRYLGSSHNWREKRMKWNEKTMMPLQFTLFKII